MNSNKNATNRFSSHSQIDENEQLMKRLEEETAALKEEVAQLHADLSTEREKLDDVMAAYSRENEEAMTEFVELRSEKEALMAERDALLEKVGDHDNKMYCTVRPGCMVNGFIHKKL